MFIEAPILQQLKGKPMVKNKKIAIVSYQFNKVNLRKQPWNYVYELGKRLKNEGYKISVITDGGGNILEREVVDGLTVYRIKTIRPSQIKTIKEILVKEGSEVLVWSIAPKSFIFEPTFKKLEIPIVGLLSHSLYTLREVLSAQLTLGRYDLSLFIQNALIPGFIFKNFINSSFFKGIVVLSRRNRNRLLEMGCGPEKIWLLRHGMEKGIDELNETKDTIQSEKLMKLRKKENEKILLYMGGVEKVRGLDFLIKSFAKALSENKNLKLVMLLRTNNPRDVFKIRHECEKLKILDNVQLVQGILSKESVDYYISISDFVVLPFILVPSEVPISILEAMKFGKPVISTDVDGIPELIQDRGILVQTGDKRELKNAILRLAQDDEFRQRLSDNCLSFMAKYPTWKENADKFVKLLEGRNVFGQKRIPKVVFITGVDGAGKTLYTKMLLEELKKQGVDARHVWSRYNNFLSKPLLGLTRLTGHNYRECHEGVEFGYHDFGRSKILSSVFTFLQMIDVNFATYFKISRRSGNGTLLVCDRGPYDTLVDVMLDTDKSSLSRRCERTFLNSLPEDREVIYIYRPLEAIYKTRPKLKHDRSLAAKHKLYQDCCERFGWKKLNNVGLPNSVFERMVSYLNGN